ncbi:unnamed protein product [Adineta steineri]|uniref:NAD(P)(+)--arginine ADP-ribosyltransferase n=1 Tax=Adineta steineri TaxID=433720 RepID=A0A819ECA8_9BILA|nr:unnamed protein product [Adineta steineri]CAF3848175.1 unnamed protein product [Adineta steineri]
MANTENHETQPILGSTVASDDISLQSSKIQNYIGVWLDDNCNENTYIFIKKALHDIFESFESISDWSKCIPYINEPRPGKIILIISHKIGQNLIPLLLCTDTSSVEYIYVHCTNENEQSNWNCNRSAKLQGGFITIESLTQQIKSDISVFDKHTNATVLPATTPVLPPAVTTSIFDEFNTITTSNNDQTHPCSVYAVPAPATCFFDGKVKNIALKDLSEDAVWFIQFQLLVEILIRMEKSEKAKEDIISICRAYYEDDKSQQCNLNKFENEVHDISKAIYWYTAATFLVHLLNKVCGTEDVDHIYRFRLFISNLHHQIILMQHNELTTNVKKKKPPLYRGKVMTISTFENFRKNINGLVAMKGFLSTTTDRKVAEMFAGDGTVPAGSVSVMFKLNIDNWKECKPSAAINHNDSAIKDEEEVLFSIGSIWKINSVANKPENGMWCIELTSCPEENKRSIELTNYLKEQLGETSDLWTLGEFLMKMGEYNKAEKYYHILKTDLKLPKRHADRAKIYSYLGIIHRELNNIPIAIDYFKQAIEAAPRDRGIKSTVKYNEKLAQEEFRQAPKVFLGKRLASSDVLSKSLFTNDISTPILKNNLGRAAYQQKKYNEAITLYEEAICIMLSSELSYLHEISCVYNNLGAVKYDQEDYSTAKDYFEKAIFTIQQLNLKHPWISDYIENLACAQEKISKRQRVK